MKSFIHNVVVHPFCGTLWFAADLLANFGFKPTAKKISTFSDGIHKKYSL